MRRSSLLALLVLASCSKPKDVTLDELGVTLTLPGDWSRKKHGEDIAISSGMTEGVILRRESKRVKTLAEAREAPVVGFQIREEKQLPTGDDTDFGTAEKPMLLRMITSFLTTLAGTVSCQLQLVGNQDAAPIMAACASMRPK